MVEHADLLDTQLLHEPKGIKESSEGQVYVSTVSDPALGPWGGEWRKLKVEDLDLVIQQITEQEYQDPDDPRSLTSSIAAQTTGSMTTVTSFGQASKNDQELFLVVSNLLSRVAKLENNVNKLITVTNALVDGLKALELFSDGE